LVPPEQAVPKLRELCREHSRLTALTPVPDGRPDWVFDDGVLRNTRADYFSISLRESGLAILMMEQREPALVMLLVADIDGVESVLLSLRTEPGLIGLTNFSSTIQSTASNYLRRHGGKATPFIDVASDPRAFGTVLYEGEHFDWGDYYVYKTKRFLIVKLPGPEPAPPGYHWVNLGALRSLLSADYLITNDLRVALNYLARPVFPPIAGDSGDEPVPDRRILPVKPDLGPDVVDSRGVRLTFRRTDTQTREVSSWVQPLLVPAEPMRIALTHTGAGSERLFAVEKRTQPGLLGRQLWFPAEFSSGSVMRRVANSAEGGRFWRFHIDLETQTVDAPGDRDSDKVEWLTEAELAALVAIPLRTSLELRMAWSLAAAESPG
jgi:hypothetical protein